MRTRPLLFVLGMLIFGGCSQQVWAGSIDIGAGLGFADSSDSEHYEGGWDLQAGYEGDVSADWSLGGELHIIHGWTSKYDTDTYTDTSMYFQSTALYLTVRPHNRSYQWLQLKGGIVSADYKTLTEDWHGDGTALGVGVVMGNDPLRIHILDYYRYQLGGRSFNIYSLSLIVLFH